MEPTTHYAPLNEDEDESRLITIAPYISRSSCVECSIETVSLKAYTPDYQEFKVKSTSAGRKQVLEWEKCITEAESSDRAKDKHNRDHMGHRFHWGDYAALSYVWGDPQDRIPIILNGKMIPIQRNLEACLRILSSKAEFHGRYKLWIDALCIDQRSPVERSSEIKRMRTIYGNAREVIAWLGSESDHSGEAVDLIENLCLAWSKGLGHRLEDTLRCEPGYLGLGSWLALNAFMSRDYWTRSWIVQEIILGSSSATIYIGNRCVAWNSFCQAIGLLFEHLWTVKNDILAREVQLLCRPQDRRFNRWKFTSLQMVFRDLWSLGKNEASDGDDHLSFGQLLDLSLSGESKDPRDKVYGLIAMMDPQISRKTVPDYTILPSEVFASIARTYIEVHQNLEVVREGNPWGEMKTPSWAADWTWKSRIRHRRVTSHIWGPFWGPKDGPPSNELGMPFRASADVAMEPSISTDNRYLTCRGLIVDEVDGLSAREDGYFAWASETIHQQLSKDCAYKGSDGVKEALYRTLLLDRVSDGQRPSEKHAVILNMPAEFAVAKLQFHLLGWKWLGNQDQYYYRWTKWRKANEGFELFGRALDSYFSETIPTDTSEYYCTEAYSCNNRTSQGRRFLTTLNGYMGWGPDNMFGNDTEQLQRGDKIAILFGCSTPIVVRPTGEYFQVLGEAYIHGLMDGEGLTSLETGQCQAQEFVFR